MNCVNHLVTESLPGYLKGLPIPNTVCNPYHLTQCHPVLLFLRCLAGSPSRWEIGRGLFPLASLWGASPTCPFRSTSCNQWWFKAHPAGINTLNWNPQGLAHSPVVGPFLREKLTMLPGMQVFLKNISKVKTWNQRRFSENMKPTQVNLRTCKKWKHEINRSICRTQGWTPVSKWTVQRCHCSLANNLTSTIILPRWWTPLTWRILEIRQYCAGIFLSCMHITFFLFSILRCWKSKKFPYCDGSHAKHNSLTGDNVGPLIIKKAA